ncbi:MAG: Uma2 family endonuclease [Spirosomataceae bacterium]
MSVDQFFEMPNLPLLIEQARIRLEAEKVIRQHFYETVDENTKMEFINGEIIFQSPVKKMHNEATGNLYMLIKLYTSKHDLGWTGVEKVLVSLTRNDYEPDVCFWKKDRAQHFTEDQMQFPAPNLVIEVLSPKTSKIDRTTKYVDYEAHGVHEYWIVDPKKKQIEQFILINGHFYLRFKGTEGFLKSESMEGFTLDVEAVFDSVKMNQALVKILT